MIPILLCTRYLTVMYSAFSKHVAVYRLLDHYEDCVLRDHFISLNFQCTEIVQSVHFDNQSLVQSSAHNFENWMFILLHRLFYRPLGYRRVGMVSSSVRCPVGCQSTIP
jgi:hypothetical protein